MLNTVADELVAYGHAHVRPEVSGISEYTIAAAAKAMNWLIDYYGTRNLPPQTRAGEDDPDLLLVRRNVQEGKDVKSFFHFAHDADWYHEDEVRACFVRLSHLYEQINAFTAQVLNTIADAYPHLFTIDVVKQFVRTTRESAPYNTTTMRGVWYPPGERIVCARPHYDRSLLTAHCGDSMGTLNRYQTGHPPHAVSPAIGHMLLFWGVKAAWASNGMLKPMLHGSETIPGMPRSALVQFCHADVGRTVVDAGQSFVECCAHFGLSPHEAV